MNGAQHSLLSQVASLLAETATDQEIASLVRALRHKKDMVPPTLSSILTAIYATLNVAGSIGYSDPTKKFPSNGSEVIRLKKSNSAKAWVRDIFPVRDRHLVPMFLMPIYMSRRRVRYLSMAFWCWCTTINDTSINKSPHATGVARASKGAWRYATVWRVADRWNIALTAGRETMGRRRLSVEQRAAVIELDRANPEATQAEIARAVGISRPSVSRIVPRRRSYDRGDR
jgi:hypothetical protein